MPSSRRAAVRAGCRGRDPIDAASCHVEVGGNDLTEMALWLGLGGFEFTVHEPAELRDHLTALAQRMLRATRLPAS